MTLDELFKREGADKQTGMHGYAPVYEELFSRFTKQPISLLEIGIYQAASIRAWLEYFPYGRIYGIDLVRWDFSAPGFEQWTGDQSDKDFMAKVIADAGSFDIIIDDGSHRHRDQWASFESLWPALVPGGYYCIEDIQCWFDTYQNSDYHGWSIVTIIAELINWHGQDYIGRPSGLGTVPEVDRAFDWMRIHKGLLIIHKKP